MYIVRARYDIRDVRIVSYSLNVTRGAGRVSGQGGQNSARSAGKFFRLPTLVFSLPTLPYVTVAHPAHRTEADLRAKASLAINQDGPSPLHSV